MKIYVTKRFTFEACHHLPYYYGACNNLHGHSYKVEVTVGGLVQEKGEKSGMIIDFKDLKEIIKSEIGKYDHQNLNDFFENPTAELMATTMFFEVQGKLKEKNKYMFLKSIKLWETEDSYATVVNEDF